MKRGKKFCGEPVLYKYQFSLMCLLFLCCFSVSSSVPKYASTKVHTKWQPLLQSSTYILVLFQNQMLNFFLFSSFLPFFLLPTWSADSQNLIVFAGDRKVEVHAEVTSFLFTLPATFSTSRTVYICRVSLDAMRRNPRQSSHDTTHLRSLEKECAIERHFFTLCLHNFHIFGPS